MKWVYLAAGIALYIKMLLLSNPTQSLPFSIVEAVVQEFEHADCGLMLVDRKENKIIRLARTGTYNIRPAVSLTP